MFLSWNVNESVSMENFNSGLIPLIHDVAKSNVQANQHLETSNSGFTTLSRDNSRSNTNHLLIDEKCYRPVNDRVYDTIFTL
jgi:hypothetical protein